LGVQIINITQTIKTLPEQQALEILDFVDFIQGRHGKTSQIEQPHFID
jgi:hypothetical protein